MNVYRIPIPTGDKETFKVPSTSEIGMYYTVNKLHTTAGTYVYKCECIGYMTRAKANPFYMCKHIRKIREYLGESDT